MDQVMPRYGITVPYRQLACTPVTPNAATAWARWQLPPIAAANRHALAHTAREISARTGGARLDLACDLSHNLAKLGTHQMGGKPALLCVHLKGAMTAFPPGHPDVSPDMCEAGQPVPIPGSMGTFTYLLAGVPAPAFLPPPATARRVISRHQAVRTAGRPELRRRLEAVGIAVRGASAQAWHTKPPKPIRM